MSAPPEKPRPAPVITIAWTFGSASAAFSASTAAVRTAVDRAFTGGLSSVTTAIPSTVSSFTISASSCIFRFLILAPSP